jgi:hypothetical protein
MGRIKELTQYSGAIQRTDVWFMVDGDSFQKGMKMSAQQIYTLAKGADGRNIEIQNSGTYIQWRLQGDASWTNLVQLSSLKGADGKQIEIQVAGGYIQTRLTGGDWVNLIAVADLKGDKGDNALPPALSFQITALASNTAPTASVSGTYPNLTVALGIPKGQDAAAPNISFSITALAPGSDATANVTGTYPNLIVALGIPKGQDAAAPAFSVSAESKAPGTAPEVAVSGTYPNLALTFKIPQGLQGQQGRPVVVLPNGNYGNWDNGLGQYVDSGVAASATIVLDQTPVNFTEAEVRANIQSGEGVTALFGKIKKWFSDLGALAFKSKVNYATEVENAPTAVSAFENDAGYQTALDVEDAVAGIDLSPYEQISNKVDVSSQATATQYPTAKSVWDLVQDVIATIPAGGLKVPLSINLESILPDPATLAPGDYFFIQNMDETAEGHTGRAWVNYTDPTDTETELIYYKVTDQYFDADGTSLEIKLNGSIGVKAGGIVFDMLDPALLGTGVSQIVRGSDPRVQNAINQSFSNSPKIASKKLNDLWGYSQQNTVLYPGASGADWVIDEFPEKIRNRYIWIMQKKNRPGWPTDSNPPGASAMIGTFPDALGDPALYYVEQDQKTPENYIFYDLLAFYTEGYKEKIDFITGSNAVTTLTNLDLSIKRFVIATVSANQTLSVTGVPPGNLVHILVKNTASAEIAVTIPVTGSYISRVGDTATVPAGELIEMSILYDETASQYIINAGGQ